MTLILKTRTDVEDLTTGCTFFGTGGGGSKELGLNMLYPHIDAGKKIEIIDVDKVKDKDWVACAYYSGTIAPPTPEIEALRTRFPWDYYEGELAAGLGALEDYMGVKFAAVAPFELGGVNTPAPIDAAVKHDIPCVDGDYSGRAVPEICQNTVCIKGFAMAPMALIDWFGNKTIVQHIINYEMGERLSKALSEVAWGRLGNVAFPVQGKDFHDAIIPGTLSKSYNVGRIIRESRESSDDPAERIVEKIGGWVVFKGEVVERNWENRAGYMWGETLIKGSGVKPGSKMKVWYKNENHVTWLDGKPWLTSPDIIEIIDAKTGEPITNTDIKKGDQVSVIGMKGEEIFRSPEGLKVLGPRHFGFDLDYKPIEDLI
ncbi:MAG: DUF917 domain-containing protein [Candidatus Thorarchaeota archaeon]|jgi:DUF917 family protein